MALMKSSATTTKFLSSDINNYTDAAPKVELASVTTGF
jgi:hypothetical protein